MKLTKCDNGHFYDGDKYPKCPHCGKLEPIKANMQVAQNSVQHSTKSVKKSIRVEPPCDEDDETILIDADDEEQTLLLTPEMEAQYAQNPSVSRHTVTKTSQRVVSRTMENDLCSDEPDEAEEPAADPVQVSPLQAAVGQARGRVSTEETKTVAFYNFAETEPVVGWLVCVRGEYKGESFPLKTGRNLIGRSLKMDVPLAKELSISRDKHAIIIYEPKKRVFYIQPGDGNGLIYVNDDLLMVPSQIVDFDRIQLGSGEFILRTLCGEGFSWEDFA